MRKRDLWWLLAAPIYLVLGTLRHEGSHALVALASGAQLTEFVFLPGIKDGQLYFGYVRYIGDATWLFTAAPYISDFLTFSIFFAVCMWLPFKRHWLWLNLVILGMGISLVNSSYQYLKPLIMKSSDVGRLFTELPGLAVHTYFLFTIALYVVGLVLVFGRSRHIQELGETNE